MKAAILENYGPPEAFQIREMTAPEPKEGEILVQNHASSVNPVDTLVRQGKTKLITGSPGELVIGSDFCGTVLTSRNARYKSGDEVFGFISAVRGGAYAENIVVKEKNTCLKPSGIGFTEAASLPLVAVTAWQGLIKQGKLKAGDQVLILGCTGGVGTAAVQIARSQQATVSGTCSALHLDFALELGCTQAWSYERERIPQEKVFDLIFDTSGKYALSDFKHHLAKKGVFVSTRGGADTLGGAVETIAEFVFNNQMKLVMVRPDPEDLEKIKDLVENGQLKACVSDTYPLDKIANAHKKAERRGFTGKIAIEID